MDERSSVPMAALDCISRVYQLSEVSSPQRDKYAAETVLGSERRSILLCVRTPIPDIHAHTAHDHNRPYSNHQVRILSSNPTATKYQPFSSTCSMQEHVFIGRYNGSSMQANRGSGRALTRVSVTNSSNYVPRRRYIFVVLSYPGNFSITFGE